MSEKNILHDHPNFWAEHPTGGFLSRWLPGAFGDRLTLHGVEAFVVERDEWDMESDPIRRTIVKARVME